jgi:Recombination endonuclease VII
VKENSRSSNFSKLLSQVLHEERLSEYICCVCVKVLDKTNKLRILAKRSDHMIRKNKDPVKVTQQPKINEPQLQVPNFEPPREMPLTSTKLEAPNEQSNYFGCDTSQSTVYYQPECSYNTPEYYESMLMSGSGDPYMPCYQQSMVLQPEESEESLQNITNDQIFRQTEQPGNFDWLESVVGSVDATLSGETQVTEAGDEEYRSNAHIDCAMKRFDDHCYVYQSALKRRMIIYRILNKCEVFDCVGDDDDDENGGSESLMTSVRGFITSVEPCVRKILDLEVLQKRCIKVKVEMSKDPVLKFKSYTAQQLLPFVFYGDFECMLPRIQTAQTESVLKPNVSSSEHTHLHTPISFSYQIASTEKDRVLKEIRLYRGLDCVEKFMCSLIFDVVYIYNEYFKNPKPMEKMTRMMQTILNCQKRCRFCDKTFGADYTVVTDHDHINGKIRGLACSHCNLQVKTPKHISFFFHGGSHYDFSLLFQGLGNKRIESIKVLPKHKSSYISFSLKFYINEDCKGETFEVRFLDSYRFFIRIYNHVVNHFLSNAFKTALCFVDTEKVIGRAHDTSRRRC